MKALGQGSVASFVKVGLTVAWWVLWICAGALSLAAVGYAALQILMATGAVDPTILARDGGDVVVFGRAGESGITIAYDEAWELSWQIVVPALLIGAVVIVGGLLIVSRLRKLFDSFTSGEPFRRENAGHLRVIWITMAAIELLRYALLALTGILIAAYGLPEGATATLEARIDLTNWLSIFVLIVLAEVFREGARLKEEQELTI